MTAERLFQRRSARELAPEEDMVVAALLGQSAVPLSPNTQRLLRQALLGAAIAEQAIAAYPAHGPNDSDVAVLRSTQRFLFLNDYAYAAQVSGELDCERGPAAYTNALRLLRHPDVVAQARENMERDPLREPRPTAPFLQPRYQDLLASGNPGFSNVLHVLAAYTPNDPASTDLLNDALQFVASRTLLRGFARIDRAEAQKIERAERSGQPVSLGLTKADLDAVADDGSLGSYQGVDAVRYRIFAYRLKEYHGIRDEEVMRALSGVTLEGVHGPDLLIGCPDP